MHARPLILITPNAQQHGAEFCDVSLSLSQNYSLAIQDAGGLPWVLPLTVETDDAAECVRRCDGVLLSGGDDVHPALYASRLPARLRRTVTAEDPRRDALEIALVREVLRQRKPLLAICRGQQLLNVALGGTLVVDIPLQRPGALDHRQLDRKSEPVHEILVAPDSILAKALGGTRSAVNSTHHQAVDRVADPLRVTAVSPDGLIEGLELRGEARGWTPYLAAVQFHPERLYRAHPEFRPLFGGFVEFCRNHRRLHDERKNHGRR